MYMKTYNSSTIRVKQFDTYLTHTISKHCWNYIMEVPRILYRCENWTWHDRQIEATEMELFRSDEMYMITKSIKKKEHNTVYMISIKLFQIIYTCEHNTFLKKYISIPKFVQQYIPIDRRNAGQPSKRTKKLLTKQMKPAIKWFISWWWWW
jgi:hypothetical protein